MRAISLTLLFIAVFALVAVTAHKKTAPVFPTQYEAEVHLALPYAKLNEPIMVWYDQDNQQQRMDYYGGVNSVYYLGNLNTTVQVVPNGVNSTLCLRSTNSPVQLTSVFPDLTNFVLLPEPVLVRGVVCDNWQFTDPSLGQYNFYVNVNNQEPVEYRMMGYDSLFGSHFDEYVLVYDRIVIGVNPHAFDLPMLHCVTPSPSQTETFSNPLHDLSMLHPQSASRQATEESIHNKFHDFVNKHGRTYGSLEERQHRRNVFARNMRYVNAVNRQNLGFTLRLNHLADLTADERRIRNNPFRPSGQNGANGVHVARQDKQSLPASVDWRTKGGVTAVKDQGVCGSCWSFGAAQAVEAAIFIQQGKLVVLSEQALVDCSWPQGNNGCDGGLDYQAYQWMMTAGGIPTEQDYSYLMSDSNCLIDSFGSSDIPAAARVTAYINVTSFDEAALMDAVATRGPISISIDASLDSFSFYHSGVFSDPACKNGLNDLDHTVLLVGYGTDVDGTDYWIVKNSWSTHWGNEGYVWIARNGNLCGVATTPTYVNIA